MKKTIETVENFMLGGHDGQRQAVESKGDDDAIQSSGHVNRRHLRGERQSGVDMQKRFAPPLACMMLASLRPKKCQEMPGKKEKQGKK